MAGAQQKSCGNCLQPFGFDRRGISAGTSLKPSSVLLVFRNRSNFTGIAQGVAGKQRTDQFINQNPEQGHVSDNGGIHSAKDGSLIHHAQGNTGLRQKGNSQILDHIGRTLHCL